jgi:pilus assembly protein CpaB
MLLGLAAAAVAFLGVFAVGSLSGHSAPVATTKVLVAARDIQAREVMSPDMAVLQSMPATTVPPDAVARFADIKGQTALVTILKGQALTTNLLSANPDANQAQTAYLPIPKGFVARAIPSGEQQGVAGYIAPGDYINVVATVNTNLFGDARGRQVTKLVFPNLHVIRVGPAQPGKAGQTQGVASSLTVVMNVCDAEMMDWLLANAKLTYVLLSYKDYSSPPTAPDASCPTVAPSSAVGPTQVNDRYGFTSI